MRVAPIIHTRTFKCDFNSEFLVRPNTFMDSDVKWARKNVLGATDDIDGLNGVRWLIADNQKYRMAGVVGFLENICSNCQLSEDDKRKSEELFCDDKGRLTYAFIGVVTDKSNNSDYGKLTYEYLWNIYIEKIYPIWKSTYQKTILEPFYDVKTETYYEHTLMPSVNVGSKQMFESNQILDYDIFTEYFCNSAKNNFSFCSNIMNFNMLKQSEFSIITTSQNNITRMKRNNINVSNSVSHEKKSNEKNVSIERETVDNLKIKKKHFVKLVICSMILLIIILMLLLGKIVSSQNNGQFLLKILNKMNMNI